MRNVIRDIVRGADVIFRMLKNKWVVLAVTTGIAYITLIYVIPEPWDAVFAIVGIGTYFVWLIGYESRPRR